MIARLWEETATGWQIVNFAERQELALVAEMKNEARRIASEKANCARWHGPKCWMKGKGCGRERSA